MAGGVPNIHQSDFRTAEFPTLQQGDLPVSATVLSPSTGSSQQKITGWMQTNGPGRHKNLLLSRIMLKCWVKGRSEVELSFCPSLADDLGAITYALCPSLPDEDKKGSLPWRVVVKIHDKEFGILPTFEGSFPQINRQHFQCLTIVVVLRPHEHLKWPSFSY